MLSKIKQQNKRLEILELFAIWWDITAPLLNFGYCISWQILLKQRKFRCSKPVKGLESCHMRQDKRNWVFYSEKKDIAGTNSGLHQTERLSFGKGTRGERAEL